MIEVRKYRHTRFWAVYADGELLAVVIYRKGARAIVDMLLKTQVRKESTDAAACSGASMTVALFPCGRDVGAWPAHWFQISCIVPSCPADFERKETRRR